MEDAEGSWSFAKKVNSGTYCKEEFGKCIESHSRLGIDKNGNIINNIN
jgi:hypothetical protein